MDVRELRGHITLRRLIVGLVGLWLFGLLLANDPGVGLVVLLIAGGWVYWRYQRRQKRRAEAAAEQAAIEREVDEGLRFWREEPPPEGVYTVTLTSVAKADVEWLLGGLSNLGENPALDLPDEEVIFDRVEHIGPQPLVSRVSEAYAVRLKKAIEQTGARVKITDAPPRVSSGTRREAIPERIRNEVWRRDGGQCVDCGSRERLEYDHIIPFSKGGSNTARNLELRCESCNRKKAAKI